METVLLGSFLIQYDAIEAFFKQMKPFLNISNETGHFYHRSIFLLKILVAMYVFRVKNKNERKIKHSGICREQKNYIFTDIIPNILCAFVILLLCQKPLGITGEFLIDIFMLIVSLKYAAEAYKMELQKLSSIIFMFLFVQWYVNRTFSTEEFSLFTYIQILALLYLSYLPMRPNNPKYRQRLTYLYILMSIWVLCKLCQHCGTHKFEVATRADQMSKLESEKSELDGMLQNLNVTNLVTENVLSSCNAQQETVQIKAEFSSNQEQNTTEKLERLSKSTRFSEGIQNENTTTKSNSLDLKEDIEKDYENSKLQLQTLDVHDIERNQRSVSPESNGIENKQKTGDEEAFQLLETVHTSEESMVDEPNDVHSKFTDKIYKNIFETENKEMTAESEEIHSGSVSENGLESSNEASAKGNYKIRSKALGSNKVTEVDRVAESDVKLNEAGKRVQKKDEAEESNDVSSNHKGKKILNGKIILKRHGEINKASKVKSSKHLGEVGISDSVVQNDNHSINESQRFVDSGMQGTTGRNLAKKIHIRKVNKVRIGHKEGTELQIKGESKSRSFIKPKKVRTVTPEKTSPIEMKKSVVKGRVKIKKKDILAIGESSSGGESKDGEVDYAKLVEDVQK